MGSIHILLKVFASETWLFQEFLHQGHHITPNTSRPSSKNKQRLIKTSLSKRYSKACLCSSPWMAIETMDSRGLKFPQECLLREGKVQNTGDSTRKSFFCKKKIHTALRRGRTDQAYTSMGQWRAGTPLSSAA